MLFLKILINNVIIKNSNKNNTAIGIIAINIVVKNDNVITKINNKTAFNTIELKHNIFLKILFSRQLYLFCLLSAILILDISAPITIMDNTANAAYKNIGLGIIIKFIPKNVNIRTIIAANISPIIAGHENHFIFFHTPFPHNWVLYSIFTHLCFVYKFI